MTRLIAALCFFTGCLAAETPENRAIAYLSTEVPKWSKENGCFSCHNDGDGARALYIARARGYKVPTEALASTTAWVTTPERWDSNRGNPAGSDKRLARIQFGAALVASGNRTGLMRAAEMIAPTQDANGSWPVDVESAAGSPATYGPVLATYLARETLLAADQKQFAEPIYRAAQWLNRVKPSSNLDRAAAMLAGQSSLLETLLSAQNSDGGWGPVRHAPSEIFDTALVLLAITGANSAIAKGRRFLIANQLPTGGWPATTRPSGGESYAQHISTTAWATLALISTNPERH